MFFIAAGMFAIGAIVFAVCVKGTVLPWADNVVVATAKSIDDIAISGTQCESVAENTTATTDSTHDDTLDEHPAPDDRVPEVTRCEQNTNVGNVFSATVRSSSAKTYHWLNGNWVQSVRKVLVKNPFRRNQLTPTNNKT